LPPQPSSSGKTKELPDIPEFYIVRPAPSNARVDRNDSRVFINRTTMERINVCQGSVLLIQRHNPIHPARQPQVDSANGTVVQDDGLDNEVEEEENGDVEQTTVGVAWPMDRIEPNGT
jgi:hypothetical protein